MREELAEHEGVVGLGVVLREPDVLVHVEGYDMTERDSPGLVCVDERLVNNQGAAACWKTQDKGILRAWAERVYTFCTSVSGQDQKSRPGLEPWADGKKAVT